MKFKDFFRAQKRGRVLVRMLSSSGDRVLPADEKPAEVFFSFHQ
jgi:hypothetical protein